MFLCLIFFRIDISFFILTISDFFLILFLLIILIANFSPILICVASLTVPKFPSPMTSPKI
jgi:hypothetical protein